MGMLSSGRYMTCSEHDKSMQPMQSGYLCLAMLAILAFDFHLKRIEPPIPLPAPIAFRGGR